MLVVWVGDLSLFAFCVCACIGSRCYGFVAFVALVFILLLAVWFVVFCVFVCGFGVYLFVVLLWLLLLVAACFLVWVCLLDLVS